MSWAGAVRAENKFYLGLGAHQSTLSYGDEALNAAYPTQVFTIPLILGATIGSKIPIAIEFQYHSGTATKTIAADTLKSKVTVKYGLTLLEVQPHLALGEDKSALLIVGLGELSFTVRVRESDSSGSTTETESDSAGDFYFGAGLQYAVGKKGLLRLALRSMSFPVEGGGDIKNTNIGLSGLYTF